MKLRKNPNRRTFIKTTSAGAAGVVALTSLSMPKFAMANAGEDYKALVQITLAGGNDSVNTFLNMDDAAFET